MFAGSFSISGISIFQLRTELELSGDCDNNKFIDILFILGWTARGGLAAGTRNQEPGSGHSVQGVGLGELKARVNCLSCLNIANISCAYAPLCAPSGAIRKHSVRMCWP